MYHLSLMTLSYIVGELTHFLINTTSREVAREIEYGEKSCFPNKTITETMAPDDKVKGLNSRIKTNEKCFHFVSSTYNSSICLTLQKTSICTCLYIVFCVVLLLYIWCLLVFQYNLSENIINYCCKGVVLNTPPTTIYITNRVNPTSYNF